MISGGKRWPAYGERAGVVIPLGYPAHSATASPSARNLTVPVQLAWRFLLFQKESALARWYRERTADARGSTRKTMIVALARKLLIALWRLVTTGEPPEGVLLRPAA